MDTCILSHLRLLPMAIIIALALSLVVMLPAWAQITTPQPEPLTEFETASTAAIPSSVILELVILALLLGVFFFLKASGQQRRLQLAVGVLALLVAVYALADYLIQPSNEPEATMLETVLPPTPAPPKPAQEVALVSLGRVATGVITAQVSCTATVEALATEDVVAPATGRVGTVAAYPGVKLKAGQLLFTLITTEPVAAKKLGRSGLTRTTKVIPETKTVPPLTAPSPKSTPAGTRSGLTRADAATKSTDQLPATPVGSKWEADLLENDAETSPVQEPRSISGTLSTAGTTEGRTEIRAVASLQVIECVAAPGMEVTAGMPLVRVCRTDRVRLRANLTPANMTGVRLGARVTVHTLATPSRTINGSVTSIATALDPLTGARGVEATVDNHAGQLMPYQVLTMEIEARSGAASLLVPTSALVPRPGVRYDPSNAASHAVWTVLPAPGGDLNQGTAHLLEVTTGLTDGKQTEVVSGLRLAQEIIMAGMETLTEGQPVRVVTESTSATTNKTAAGP